MHASTHPPIHPSTHPPIQLNESDLITAHWDCVPRQYYSEYAKIRTKLLALAPSQHSHFDYDLFGHFDAIIDTPVPQFFPYIFRTYPNARVILSIRDPQDWVRSRFKHHPADRRPFAIFDAPLDHLMDTLDEHTSLNNSVTDSVLAYLAYNTQVLL